MKPHRNERLLSPADLTPEQQDAIDRLYNFDETLLVARKGFGKAVVLQTAIEELIREGHLRRVLIIAPPKVVRNVWASEWENWSHLHAPALAVPTPESRRKIIEDRSNSIVCLSADLVPWFFQTYGRNHGFDGLAIDELTRFKSPGSHGVKTLRRHVRDFKWRVGLTATPVSECGTEIYAQALVLDGGMALGTNYDNFRLRYFRATDFNQYNWEFLPGGMARLAKDLQSLVFVADDEGYAGNLPAKHETQLIVGLPDEARLLYRAMARSMIADGIEAANTAVMVGKLQQIASGFMYREDGSIKWIHDAKYQAIADHVRTLRKQGERVLICHWYEAELRAMRKQFGTYPQVTDTGAIDKWNAGKLGVMGIHPRSGGHGLNLQRGGRHMVAVGPIWSADAWDQVIGRLWRRGQERPVVRTTCVASRTVDELVLDRLRGKAGNEQAIMRHLKENALG